MRIKLITVSIAIITFIALAGLYVTSQGVSAWDNQDNQPKQDCDGDFNVSFPGKDAKECVTPTPTPTINPCEGNLEAKDELIQQCITPTPTATPTATPTTTPCTNNCGNPPAFAGSTTNAPAAVTCNVEFTKPILNSFQADGNGSVTFGWLDSDSNVDKFSIIYGYSPDNLVYGEDNIPGNSRSITINGLQVGKSVVAQVWGWEHGCSEISNILDPIVY